MSATSPPTCDIAAFSTTTGSPLRPYQLECARAIIDSVLHGKGHTFTIMFARQMGKNELSAQLEACLMYTFSDSGGAIIKTAPSLDPQLHTSLLRLQHTLDASSLTSGHWRSTLGRTISLGNASTTFLSGGIHANVVGATASLLLEVDEAQNLDPDKYDRDFRPMASSTNATTVLYGTAWNDSSLLETQRHRNLEREEHLTTRLHFEYDWQVLAALHQPYGTFVQGEIERLGTDNPMISTQYLLQPMTDTGRLFGDTRRASLQGSHERRRMPLEGDTIVAGIDIAGEDTEPAGTHQLDRSSRRDATAITIARVLTTDRGQRRIEVLDHRWWSGRTHTAQYDGLLELWHTWQFARVSIDGTGIGAGIASFLEDTYSTRVDTVRFNSQVKSAIGWAMLDMVDTDRVQLYLPDGSPEWRQCWKEIEACRFDTRANQQLAWCVPQRDGHDDFVVSLALCCRAATTYPNPPAGEMINFPQYDQDCRW